MMKPKLKYMTGGNTKAYGCHTFPFLRTKCLL